MIDTDLHGIHVMSSKEISLVELDNVKQINSQNTYLKYGLIISGFVLVGFLAYIIRERNDEQS